MTTQPTRWSQFGVLITVFFFWGFVAASNDILIPVFKKAFNLTQAQSQYVAVAFYVAYTVGSLIYVAVSKIIGLDLLNKIGYKNGICLGLVISALGTLLFYPAANAGSFNLMLSGLFIVGLGFSLQQIAANPLAIVIGDPKTGAQRLTLAGGINNFGTTIGPLLVSVAIFGSVLSGGTEASIESVKTPYLVLGVAFILVAIFLKFSSVPNHIDLEKLSENEAQDSSKLIHKKSALGYPQLVLGMIAIFVYVGVEVSTISNLPAYLESPEGLGLDTSQIAPFVSLYWASLMIGRWGGAAGAFNVGSGAKRWLTLLLPYVAFGVFLAVNAIMKHEVSQFFGYAAVIVLMILATLASKGNPARMLLYFAACGIAALLIGMFTTGWTSVVAFISVGLFCSTMWPCIFALAITGLGDKTNQGSSLLIMMIMGGGFVSLAQGLLADKVGVHFSFIVGVACFAYLAFYAIAATRTLRNQGIDLDKLAAGSGH
ncbi:MFS transporter [Pseudoxanthomonas japonensis]|uniref:MFS transporter n=1 Tax=Pseudoxanthomonas japonensis TaxID=69284 RepID=A0ABQ6ZCZ9_9GAMM|nr:MFS transporter [Pseudoxanthomonas japonensis]KAF1722197.1 MFS transporter [Pseudoxanthomonas japonensis]MCR6626738.1 MFS transporter [Pseudoxanthomonas sp.]NCT72746.1 sugar MFS transporter [Xanthomonadaceae bacterium]